METSELPGSNRFIGEILSINLNPLIYQFIFMLENPFLHRLGSRNTNLSSSSSRTLNQKCTGLSLQLAKAFNNIHNAHVQRISELDLDPRFTRWRVSILKDDPFGIGQATGIVDDTIVERNEISGYSWHSLP